VTYEVRLSPMALRDFARLADFLSLQSPAAANRAREAISAAIVSLQEHPGRGLSAGGTLRELVIPFGRGGYAVRYRIGETIVLVTRIFHTRERR
jgi:plasmid stabilization system protein ParE